MRRCGCEWWHLKVFNLTTFVFFFFSHWTQDDNAAWFRAVGRHLKNKKKRIELNSTHKQIDFLFSHVTSPNKSIAVQNHLMIHFHFKYYIYNLYIYINNIRESHTKNKSVLVDWNWKISFIIIISCLINYVNKENIFKIYNSQEVLFGSFSLESILNFGQKYVQTHKYHSQKFLFGCLFVCGIFTLSAFQVIYLWVYVSVLGCKINYL